MSFRGKVIAIQITKQKGGSIESIGEVRALAGRGLEGDRYFDWTGKPTQGGREISLIEGEAVLAVAEAIPIEPGETRRNIVTSGVPLNHLVGREFRIGDVVLRGTKLCEPCMPLEEMMGKPGVMKAMLHRGGLRAQIVNDGVIRVGDVIHDNAYAIVPRPRYPQ